MNFMRSESFNPYSKVQNLFVLNSVHKHEVSLYFHTIFSHKQNLILISLIK